MEWFEKLGFYENPLRDFGENEVLKILDEKADDLIYDIASGSIAFVKGGEGSGKTLLLRYAIKNFRGANKIIYINASRKKELNIERLLINRNGLFKGKLFRILPRNAILLIDNIENLSERNSRLTRFFYDEGFIKSVVFTTRNADNVVLSDALKNRIGNRIIDLDDVSDEKIIRMVRERLGEKSDLISESVLKRIYELSDKNVKQFLANCSLVCEYLAKSSSKKISPKKIKELIKK